ncbi:MAG: HAMP domain-containing histidine kinase [Parasporobacterium sp.]|nr:HAMP domain-containing histidine kinase [Parasporobacterium sp.]
MIRSLRRKLILYMMIVVAILLICLMAIINIINYSSFEAQTDAILEALAANHVWAAETEESQEDTETSRIAGQGDQEEPEGDSSGESEGDFSDSQSNEGFDINGGHRSIFSFMIPDVSTYDLQDAAYYYVVIDPQGRVSEADVSRVFDPTAEVASNMALAMFRDGKRTGWIESSKYLRISDQNDTVYLFLHRDRDLKNQQRVMIVSVIVGFVFFLIIFVLVILLSGKILRPVEENIEKQKSFITNASHEIKTPLAIIQANAEALELYNGENKWTGNIREQVGRLSVILTNMLTLSKADEGTMRMDLMDINLSEIVEEILNMFRESAEKRSLTLFRHVEPDLMILANKLQVSQLVSILIDNAVKYSMGGSTVEVHAYSRDKTVFLETINRCDVLPECEPEQLFERFFRPESSRYSDQPGNGIGLSAAKAIIESYGGSITCRFEGRDAIRFTLIFRK